MILIFSKSQEFSVNFVLDWLYHKNEPFCRITEKDTVTFNWVEIDKCFDFEFYVNDTSYKYSEIKSVWFRHASIKFKVFYKNFDKKFLQFLNHEAKSLKEFFVWSMEQKKKIGSYYLQDSNKLTTLLLAKKHGFNIPKTLLTTKHSHLMDYFSNESIITKSIQDLYVLRKDNVYTANYTKDVTGHKYDNFGISLFQSKIVGIHLRVFFLISNFYACLIYGKKNDDSRLIKNKRFLPYEMSDEMKLKISKLADDLKLESGSIDFLVNEKDEFFFLEVNPVGQYGFISLQFNGIIDKKIAEYLCNPNN